MFNIQRVDICKYHVDSWQCLSMQVASCILSSKCTSHWKRPFSGIVLGWSTTKIAPEMGSPPWEGIETKVLETSSWLVFRTLAAFRVRDPKPFDHHNPPKIGSVWNPILNKQPTVGGNDLCKAAYDESYTKVLSFGVLSLLHTATFYHISEWSLIRQNRTLRSEASFRWLPL